MGTHPAGAIALSRFDAISSSKRTACTMSRLAWITRGSGCSTTPSSSPRPPMRPTSRRRASTSATTRWRIWAARPTKTIRGSSGSSWRLRIRRAARRGTPPSHLRRWRRHRRGCLAARGQQTAARSRHALPAHPITRAGAKRLAIVFEIGERIPRQRVPLSIWKHSIASGWPGCVALLARRGAG